MGDEANIGLLILRVALGLVFIAHGIKHARGQIKTTRWFGSIGFRSAGFQWFMSTATEIGAGVMLILGLLTSLAAAAVIGTVAVAFWTVHKAAGFFITNFMKEGIDVEGWEYVFMLGAAALALAILGPGELSVDDALGIADDLNGWIGGAIAGGGILMAIGELIVFWRDPAKTT